MSGWSAMFPCMHSTVTLLNLCKVMALVPRGSVSMPRSMDGGYLILSVLCGINKTQRFEETVTSTRKKIEQLLELADVRTGGERPWDMQVHDDRLYDRILAKGTLGLGEAYMDGWWDCAQLDQFICNVMRAGLRKHIAPLSLLWPMLRARLFNLQHRGRAFQVGEAHYDLGNDLFERMLDRRMTYTCGYWKDAQDLDAAQEAKLAQ